MRQFARDALFSRDDFEFPFRTTPLASFLNDSSKTRVDEGQAKATLKQVRAAIDTYRQSARTIADSNAFRRTLDRAREIREEARL